MTKYDHHGFVKCTECGGAGMVRGTAQGEPGDTVTVVSEGTCPNGHKLGTVATVTLPD